MVLIPVLIVLLLTAHALLIENYRRWFVKVKPFISSSDALPTVFFTVVIPARNEEDQITDCLQSVLAQNYPQHLFEVIVADDYSTDKTAVIIQNLQKQYLNLHLLQLENILPDKQLNSYKKKAIELAIQQAKGNWIVTTDADCTVSNNWLVNLNEFILKNNSVFVAAPVKIINAGSFISVFQCLDFMSLQGITAASVYHRFHTMCNGANLAYDKSAFYEVNGFKGIDNIASGDDMLLMHKIFVRYNERVHFLLSRDSIVETKPAKSVKEFINQRIRWASKADKFDDKRILGVLVFIYFFNLSFVVILIVEIWHKSLWIYWLAMIAAKTLIELRFMVPVARFFKEEMLLWWFPLMQPFHIIYTIVAGWLGKFGKYSWKGRIVK